MCEFKLPFTGVASNWISRAKQEIEQAGGSFNGDDSAGDFIGKTPLGSIAGSYQIVGQEIVIMINKKPLLVSCKRIEKELRGVMR